MRVLVAVSSDVTARTISGIGSEQAEEAEGDRNPPSRRPRQRSSLTNDRDIKNRHRSSLWIRDGGAQEGKADAFSRSWCDGRRS